MRELADEVHLLDGRPRNAINVYLLGDVLIDAATRQGERRIMRQVVGRSLSAHALTHAHPVARELAEGDELAGFTDFVARLAD
jgi:hydroxyacylglutathione hydrolase